jgi:hypothetical protein
VDDVLHGNPGFFFSSQNLSATCYCLHYFVWPTNAVIKQFFFFAAPHNRVADAFVTWLCFLQPLVNNSIGV